MRTPPSFDTWTVIFLYAALQGLALTAIFYSHGNPSNRSQKSFLAILMVMFCLMILEYVFWWTGYLVKVPHLMGVTAPFIYLYGPILFFYFRQVFRDQFIDFRKDWPHFLLFIFFLISQVQLYILPGATKVAYMVGTLKASAGIPWPWLNIIQMALYVIICFYEYRAEAQNTMEVKKWFRLILTLFTLFIGSVMSYYVLAKMPWFNTLWDYMISASMMVFIYAIAIYGYYHNKVFNGFEILEIIHKEKYQNSSLKSETGIKTLERLNQLMDQEKLYVDDEINLEKLAFRLQISRHQLSQVMNEHAGMNFFEYINSRRIEEAKHLLTSTSKKELNIIEIAYKVGYSNKVTFNNTFKKYTGMTPSEYRADPRDHLQTPILSIRNRKNADL